MSNDYPAAIDVWAPDEGPGAGLVQIELRASSTYMEPREARNLAEHLYRLATHAESVARGDN